MYSVHIYVTSRNNFNTILITVASFWDLQIWVPSCGSSPLAACSYVAHFSIEMDFWSNLCEFLFRDAAQNFLEEVTTIVFMCDTTSFFSQIDQNWRQYTEPELGFPRDKGTTGCPIVPLSRDKGRSKNPRTNSSVQGLLGTTGCSVPVCPWMSRDCPIPLEMLLFSTWLGQMLKSSESPD